MPPKKKPNKLVSNAEVLASLKRQNPRRKKNKVSHCEWINDNVTAFLSSGPTARSDLHSSLPDTLTEQEKLQIVNIVPTEMVDIFLIIDNLNERFTEAQQEQLLTLIQNSPETTVDVQPEVCTSEQTPMEADPVASCGDLEMETTVPADEEAFTEPMDTSESAATPLDVVTPTPSDTTTIEPKSIDHTEITMNVLDAKHIINGGPIPPNTENARSGLVSLPKVKLESS